MNNNIPNFNYNYNYQSYVKKHETKLLRKKSNSIGFFVFAYFMTMTLSATFLELLCYVRGISITTDTTALQLTQIFISVFAAFFPSLFFIIFTKSNINETIKCNHVKLSLLLPIIMFGMATSMFANAASDIVVNNFSFFGLKSNVNFNNSSESLFDNILYIISTAIVPALAEELAFRGIIMGTLRKYGDVFAIITSSVMFGVMHGNIVQIPFAFILGLIFAFIDCKTNSIIPSVIIHFANNFYAVLIDIFQNEDIISKESFYLIYYIIVFTFCILGLISLIILLKKDNNFFKMSQKNEKNTDYAPTLSLKEKNKIFFLSGGVILSLVIFLLTTILTMFTFS